MNQSDPAEGEEASLLYIWKAIVLFLPQKKEYSRALHHSTLLIN